MKTLEWPSQSPQVNLVEMMCKDLKLSVHAQNAPISLDLNSAKISIENISSRNVENQLPEHTLDGKGGRITYKEYGAITFPKEKLFYFNKLKSYKNSILCLLSLSGIKIS